MGGHPWPPVFSASVLVSECQSCSGKLELCHVRTFCCLISNMCRGENSLGGCMLLGPAHKEDSPLSSGRFTCNL